MAIRLGQLRQRVTIESFTTTLDEFGDETQTWATFATRWARVRPLQGRERFAAQQIDATVSHEVQMHHLDGVTPEMRVVHKGRYLYVTAALDVEERGRETLLYCTEKADT